MNSKIKSEEFHDRAVNKIVKARSPLAHLFRAASRFGRIRSLAIRAVCQLEGGQMWSETYRELMKVHYDVEIGNYSYGPCLQPGNLPAGTRVGNYCSLADGIKVLRRNHPVDRISQHPFFFNATIGLFDSDTISSVADNPLTIGHDVWIGLGVTIAPGCMNIGNSAVIAAGAIVTKDVPPFAIVGGIPAKMIRWRISEELQFEWERSKWWLKPVNELSGQLDAFIKPFHIDSFQTNSIV